jgi:catechol 2,3-dioxygenase-like lactoylglutathione lyase family enzyme
MIDHVTVRVQDLSRALEFYKGALAPLRYSVLMEFPGAVGLGADGKPDLWLMQTDEPLNPTHLALSGDRPIVDAFYEAALAAGGVDNGPAGLRPDYHPHYYAAFVRDPEGNNIEVVCHADPEAEPARPALAAKRTAAKARRAAPRKPAAKAKKSAKRARAKPKKTASKKAAGKKPRKKAKPRR